MSAAKASPIGSWGKEINLTIFLGFASLIFLAAQLYLTAAPLLQRSLPVEVDDAYSYILKAEEMSSSCFFQECRALNDLRMQFISETNDTDLAYMRAREYHRIFVVYHPLHSLGLIGLQSIGLTYETGYALLAIAGKVLLCVGIAYWLYVLYGPKTTAITVILLTTIVFQGQGIHTIVPSNMSLGLGFVAWALALKPRKGIGKAILALVLAMVLLHQAGKIYAGLALILYAFKSEQPINRETKITVITGTLFVLMSFLLPFVISRPELNFNPAAFYPGQWNYVAALGESLNTSMRLITTWFAAFAYAGLGIVLVILGFLALPSNRRPDWLVMGSMLFGILILSLVYIVPWFGALFFERVWIPVGILFLGLIAQLLSNYLDRLWKIAQSVFDTGGKHVVFGNTVAKQSLLIVAIITPLLALALSNYFQFYQRHFSLTLENQQQRQYFRLYKEQPIGLFGSPALDPDASVLYMDEIPLYYYLTYGGLEYGAVFYPALQDDENQQAWAQDQSLDFVVATNPIYQLSHNSDPAVELGELARLTVSTLSDLNFDSFDLFIVSENTFTEFEVEWQSKQGNTLTNIQIPAQTSGWMHFSQPEVSAKIVKLKATGNSAIRIEGFRFTSESETNWPWDVGISMELMHFTGDSTRIEISAELLAKDLLLDLEVIDDTGYTVLARVLP